MTWRDYFNSRPADSDLEPVDIKPDGTFWTTRDGGPSGSMAVYEPPVYDGTYAYQGSMAYGRVVREPEPVVDQRPIAEQLADLPDPLRREIEIEDSS